MDITITKTKSKFFILEGVLVFLLDNYQKIKNYKKNTVNLYNKRTSTSLMKLYLLFEFFLQRSVKSFVVNNLLNGKRGVLSLP